jgi:hypothetical protein
VNEEPGGKRQGNEGAAIKTGLIGTANPSLGFYFQRNP